MTSVIKILRDQNLIFRMQGFYVRFYMRIPYVIETGNTRTRAQFSAPVTDFFNFRHFLISFLAILG